PLGTSYGGSDYALMAEGFGCRGIRVTKLEDLPAAAREAFVQPGPVVLDIATDPSGYAEQLARLRG
ncbi:MAG: thiamine pyrophosphate-dependent enzyme, partial [Anderseniella sp.]|nr:thiamine pyrophosphate-dependent enzyme [Anderseniella sp.]